MSDQDRVHALRRAGLGTGAIAALFGVERDDVYNVSRGLGELPAVGGGGGVPDPPYFNAGMFIQSYDKVSEGMQAVVAGNNLRMPHDTDQPLEQGFFGMYQMTDPTNVRLAFVAQSIAAIANVSFDVFIYNLTTGNGIHLANSLSTRLGPSEMGSVTVDNPVSYYDPFGPDAAAVWAEFAPDVDLPNMVQTAAGTLLVAGTFAVGYSSANDTPPPA